MRSCVDSTNRGDKPWRQAVEDRLDSYLISPSPTVDPSTVLNRAFRSGKLGGGESCEFVHRSGNTNDRETEDPPLCMCGCGPGRRA